MKENYREILKKKMDQYAHYCYKISYNFPKEELFGIVS